MRRWRPWWKSWSPVEAYYVDNAEHEGNFWSPEVRDVIMAFVKKYR